MVDINENALYMLKQEFLVMKRKHQMNDSIQLESLIISIREREEIYKLMKSYKPDVVYHAAAHKHVPLMENSPNEAIKLRNFIKAHTTGAFLLISNTSEIIGKGFHSV